MSISDVLNIALADSRQASHLKNLELEEDESRAEKRRQMLNAAQNKAQERTAPNSPTSTGAMDSLLQKLRDAGPTQRQQREARKRARLKNNAKQRKASATLDASLSGDDIGSAENEAGLSSGGGGEGGTSDAGTDIDISLVASSTVAGGDTPTSSTTGAAPRRSPRRSVNDDPASRAQNMLQKLKGGGDGGPGGGDESDSVSLSSLGSFRNSQRTGAEEGRRARRRQRQASSNTNGNNKLGLSNGNTEMSDFGDDAAAKAKSILLSMGAKRGSAEDNNTPATSVLIGSSTDYTSRSPVDESETMILGADDLPTPTIEIKEVD